jgi:hypothetical protein
LGYPEALDSIRKIAGLAVACMEYNGAPERKVKPHYFQVVNNEYKIVI